MFASSVPPTPAVAVVAVGLTFIVILWLLLEAIHWWKETKRLKSELDRVWASYRAAYDEYKEIRDAYNDLSAQYGHLYRRYMIEVDDADYWKYPKAEEDDE